MASGIYDIGFEGVMDGSINWGADDIQVLLLKSSHTFSEVQDFVSNISADEVAGTGYSRKVLASKTTVFNSGAREYRFDAANIVWTQIQDDLTEISKAAVVFKQVTNDADSILIAYIEDSSALTFNDGEVTLAFDSTGVFKVGA